MVSKSHKITHVPLILKVCDVIFCMLAKHITGNFLDNLGVKKVLAPSKCNIINKQFTNFHLPSSSFSLLLSVPINPK
jgi:hypothetical protein